MHFCALYKTLSALLLTLSVPVYSRTAGGHDCSGFMGSASNYAPGDAVRAIQVVDHKSCVKHLCRASAVLTSCRNFRATTHLTRAK